MEKILAGIAKRRRDNWKEDSNRRNNGNKRGQTKGKQTAMRRRRRYVTGRVKNAVRKLKSGKAPGVNGIKAKLLKYIGKKSEVPTFTSSQRLANLSNKYQYLKKGNLKECSN